MAQVGHRRRSFERLRRAITVQVQYNRFHLFAVHRIFPKRFQSLFTLPLSCGAAHSATSPASPVAARDPGAAAHVSPQWGSTTFALLPHHSYLPTRASPRPREILPVDPALPLSPGACARAFPPTSPA